MGHDRDVQAQLRRTVAGMLTVAMLVFAWSAMTSGYPAPATANTVGTTTPAPDRGARAGALVAYAQTRLAAAAAATTTATAPARSEPVAALAGSLAAAPPTSVAPTTTTTTAPTAAAPATTAAPTTTTTHVHQTTTTAPATTTTTTAPTTTTTHVHETTTTTAISIPPSPGRLTEEEAIALFSQYFEPEDVDTALRVAQCESNLDPSAWNPNGYGGLFQHAISAWDSRAEAAGWAGASIFDAEANTAVSAWLVYKDGWWHWSCY